LSLTQFVRQKSYQLSVIYSVTENQQPWRLPRRVNYSVHHYTVGVAGVHH